MHPCWWFVHVPPFTDNSLLHVTYHVCRENVLCPFTSWLNFYAMWKSLTRNTKWPMNNQKGIKHSEWHIYCDKFVPAGWRVVNKVLNSGHPFFHCWSKNLSRPPRRRASGNLVCQQKAVAKFVSASKSLLLEGHCVWTVYHSLSTHHLVVEVLPYCRRGFIPMMLCSNS